MGFLYYSSFCLPYGKADDIPSPALPRVRGKFTTASPLDALDLGHPSTFAQLRLNIMSEENRWENRYRTGATPWDIGRPDHNLMDMVTRTPIPDCKALEIGCGTGDNAIWLAQRQFVVTGTDVSEMAIQRAREKASEAAVECTFFVCDFLDYEVPGNPFGLVLDRGCFHSFESHEERSAFAENAAFHLGKGGLWLSIIGSSDDPPHDTGPPQRSASDIVVAVEPYFEILSLRSSYFDSNRKIPPRAWVCLMQRREKGTGNAH